MLSHLLSSHVVLSLCALNDYMLIFLSNKELNIQWARGEGGVSVIDLAGLLFMSCPSQYLVLVNLVLLLSPSVCFSVF